MNTVQRLTQDIATARATFLDAISNVSEVKAGWKPGPDVWSIIEITEHLFWAEQGGIVGMWKTLHAIRKAQWNEIMNPITRIWQLNK